MNPAMQTMPGWEHTMPEAALPSHASTVVIGGVMGCSTLYHLAKAGTSDAILLERLGF